MQESPYIAKLEIQIWEWDHKKATEVFKNLCDDVAKLSHRFEGGAHSFPAPISMTLVKNPNFEKDSSMNDPIER